MRISDWSSDVCSSDLPADLIEQLVLRRERDRSLRLDLQQHLTGMRCSVDHQIVKRKALIYALVTNPLDERSGQPARLDIGEERQQVERTKLAFDVGAGAAACSGTRDRKSTRLNYSH